MTSNKYSVSVIGCGWLGFPFARHMVAKSWYVKGSTTTSEKLDSLEDQGIEGYVLKLPLKEEIPAALFDVDTLLVNIPPGRSNPEALKNYSGSIESLMDKANKSGRLKQIIFISSTSVYGTDEDVIDETSEPHPVTASGEAVLQAEQVVTSSPTPSVILRFGGLVGPGRHPGNFLAGKSSVRNGHQSVNMLHLTDAIRILEHMTARLVVDQLYNVVSPIHPAKEQFYIEMAHKLDVQPPTFEPSHSGNRREISVEKLLSETRYEFVFPDPMDFSFRQD